MVDVTYYVALPFGAGDDGPEPREAVECTSAALPSCAPNDWHELKDTSEPSHSVAQAIRVAVSLGMLLYCSRSVWCRTI